MKRDLENAGDYLLEIEQKCNKANKTALELLNQLKEADAELEEAKLEIQTLGGKVKQLQSMQESYVGVKGDEVDLALADFLNNFYDKGKLQVMFIRLQPGIYSFGSKKVCIKVDNGKINIRVGGGYLRINEFIDKYTTIELQNSIKKGIDPLGGGANPMQKAVSKGASPEKKAQLYKDVKELESLHPTAQSPLPSSVRKAQFDE